MAKCLILSIVAATCFAVPALAQGAQAPERELAGVSLGDTRAASRTMLESKGYMLADTRSQASEQIATFVKRAATVEAHVEIVYAGPPDTARVAFVRLTTVPNQRPPIDGARQGIVGNFGAPDRAFRTADGKLDLYYYRGSGSPSDCSAVPVSAFDASKPPSTALDFVGDGERCSTGLGFAIFHSMTAPQQMSELVGILYGGPKAAAAATTGATTPGSPDFEGEWRLSKFLGSPNNIGTGEGWEAARHAVGQVIGIDSGSVHFIDGMQCRFGATEKTTVNDDFGSSGGTWEKLGLTPNGSVTSFGRDVYDVVTLALNCPSSKDYPTKRQMLIANGGNLVLLGIGEAYDRLDRVSSAPPLGDQSASSVTADAAITPANIDGRWRVVESMGSSLYAYSMEAIDDAKRAIGKPITFSGDAVTLYDGIRCGIASPQRKMLDDDHFGNIGGDWKRTGIKPFDPGRNRYRVVEIKLDCPHSETRDIFIANEGHLVLLNFEGIWARLERIPSTPVPVDPADLIGVWASVSSQCATDDIWHFLPRGRFENLGSKGRWTLTDRTVTIEFAPDDRPNALGPASDTGTWSFKVSKLSPDRLLFGTGSDISAVMRCRGDDE